MIDLVMRTRYVSFIQSKTAHIVGLLALGAAITSVMNGFALDDVHILVNNPRIHSLSNIWTLFGQSYWPPEQGGALYRPLTILAFMIQWAIGGGSPLPFHLVNVALYIAVCIALFRLLRLLVDEHIAFLAGAIFAVHPVHVEAVANIVGQAELVVGLLTFLTMERYVRARLSGNFTTADKIVIVLSYFAACMFKEHAIILPALLASCEIVLPDKGKTLVERARRLTGLFLGLAVAGVIFVALRTLVGGELRSGGTNELFSGEAYGARVLTMLTIVPEWLRLFFWPASLSADYSFPRTRLATSFSLEMIPGLIVLISGLLIAFKMRRDKPIVSFSFAWIAITMAIPSNLIMTTGFVLAERTLFLASAGVALLAAAAAFTLHKAVQDSRHGRLTFHAAVVALLILGLVRSGVRMPVWANNLTLFTQTVADAPLSAHAHWMLAETLEKAGRRNDAADEMLKAVVLGRKNDFILLGYGGDLLARGGMCNRAMPLYRRALALTPQNQILRSNAALCLIELRKPEEARTLALAGGEGNQLLPQLASTLHLADSLTQLRTSASPVAGYVSN